MLSRSSSSARKRDLTEIEYPLLVKRVFKPSPPRHRGYAAKPRRPPPPMRVGYADHAGVAGRRGYAPATQARCDGEGRDFTPNAVSKRVRAKLMPLPSYRKRIFRSAVKVKPFGRASATLTDRIPAFSKAGIQAIPLPATAATPLSPRRPPPPMRVGYADHAGVAGRRGYAPATHAGALRRGGRDFTPNAVFQEGKGKTDALTPLIASVFFGVLSRSSPLWRASATLTEIEYPLLVKRVFTSIPLPATAATPLSPDGHRRRCESAMPTTQASPAVGATRPLRRRAATGREGGSHTKRSLPRG